MTNVAKMIFRATNDDIARRCEWEIEREGGGEVKQWAIVYVGNIQTPSHCRKREGEREREDRAICEPHAVLRLEVWIFKMCLCVRM